MERLIPLSTLEFFTQGNTMIGSVTPEDLIASPLAMLFNYRVYVEGDALIALYFIDNKCFDLTDHAKLTTESFAVSVEGIDAAAKWLEQEYYKYERAI